MLDATTYEEAHQLQRLATMLNHLPSCHMKAYSQGLREKIVEAVGRGLGKSEAARTFGISLSSVKRYAKTAREWRSLAPKKRPGSHLRIDGNTRRLLEADLEERPTATLPKRCEFLERSAGVRVSESTVSRMLKRIGWTPKKRLRVLRPWCSRRLARPL